jgi:hypothetical protein
MPNQLPTHRCHYLPGQGHDMPAYSPFFINTRAHLDGKQHKASLEDVITLGEAQHHGSGGRVAPESNCTLSGSPNNGRAFVKAFRNYDKLFLKTDFKRTDGVPLSKHQSLCSPKRTDCRLWSVSGEKVLALKFAGEHLTLNYHWR